MKTQLSRKTFDELKRYSGVYQQMGRMLTDADWNELSDLNKERLADIVTDIIGSGTPKERGIMEITEQADGSNSYRLLWGYAYVDGIVCQLRPDANALLTDPQAKAFEYLHQADFPQAGSEPAGDYTLYLDVWERTVTTLEDPEIIDVGLHGADTCTRTQTMAQVKWCATDIEPENSLHNPAKGNSLLSLQLRQGSTDIDDCDPCADEIALQDNVGNYLFRVELHHVDYDAVTGAAQGVVFKWSSENGAEQYKLTDKPAGFVSSRWAYEFFSGESEQFASEKHLGMHHAAGFTPIRGELSETYSEPAGYSLVRRWDGYCELINNAGIWTLVSGIDRGSELSDGTAVDAPGHIENGSAISINLESITLDLDLADNQLVAGDFWQAEVRQATNIAEPVLLSSQIPQGIEHHYMTLGSVIDDEFNAYESGQCKRFEFPALTDITAKDVCYDSECDDFSGAKTVEDALDKLCKQNDLKWHNKHLHGWGIVCGLIAQCNNKHACPVDNEQDIADEVEIEPELSEEQLAQQVREVVITSGYALTCDGEDVNLNASKTVDVINRIEKLEENGKLILDDEGNGTVCLRIEPGADGLPRIVVEPYDPNSHNSSLLDGTLLMDFIQDCFVDLFEAVIGEFEFLNASELDIVEGGNKGLVSAQRRKFVSFLNLIFQFINSENGRYVFLSNKEHLILRDLYSSLQCLLRSKTFCGMFEGQDFPDYPFPDAEMTTYFGKNNHSRVKMHPSGKLVYTYGGTDNTINVYDVGSKELIEVLEMPSVEGAEVSAITFSQDGELLFASASVRAIDTLFGISRINDKHAWEEMIVLCNMDIMEMEVSDKDPGLIYAVAYGKGLYYLRPEILMDETKPQPIANYEFNALGHLKIDVNEGRAYCTSTASETENPAQYDEIVVCDLNKSGELLVPDITIDLQAAGTDGIAIGPEQLYVVVNGQESNKQLWTYNRPLDGENNNPDAILDIENTQVALAYHLSEKCLLLAMEDGYRIQRVSQDGKTTEFMRIPVQLQPVDVIVDENSDNVYALNFMSNTLSLIPAAELKVSEDFLFRLTSYRNDILLAFYNLFAGLLQYLKDCFCDHLLVKCPECDDEKLYLAKVEIKSHEVYNVCNFDKRKYVKTFPTMSYWFSLIPIMPFVKKAVSSICCSILPDYFTKQRDQYITPVEQNATHHMAFNDTNSIKSTTARNSMTTYQRTDINSLWRDNTKGFKLTGTMLRDSAVNNLDTGRRKNIGVKKNALMDSSVNDAQTVLSKNRVEVTEVKPYDPKEARIHIVDYVTTPDRIEPGSKVTLYEKEGKVVYYAVEKQPASAAAVEISPEIKREIEQLEDRKTQLSDLADLKAELSAAEARKNNVVELDSIKTEFADLQTEKSTMQAELAGLKSQIDSVKLQRVEEEQKLQEVDALRTAMAADINQLNDNLLAMDAKRKEINLEITKTRPPVEVVAITAEEDVALKEIGIRTTEELANADADKVAVETGISPAKATKIIKEARSSLILNPK